MKWPWSKKEERSEAEKLMEQLAEAVKKYLAKPSPDESGKEKVRYLSRDLETGSLNRPSAFASMLSISINEVAGASDAYEILTLARKLRDELAETAQKAIDIGRTGRS